MNGTNKVIKITLSLALMAFVFTMTPATTFFQPAQAATLTGVRVVPMSNLATMQTTYDFIFRTATNAQINTIEINFVLNPIFNVASATLAVERSGIGSGSITTTPDMIKYTLNDAVSVPAGTQIKLEIARIIANAPGNFKVIVTTKDAGGNVIDTAQSPSFSIFAAGSTAIADSSITGSDISPGFMIKKTLKDDAAGNAKGWDPILNSERYFIVDSDVTGPRENILIDINVNPSSSDCRVIEIFTNGRFDVFCDGGLVAGTELHYVITKLPANVVTSSLSASSSPFDSSQNSQNVFPPSLP